jgi:predicted TIM-barrel fold metal-dependent hydrolase
MTDAYAPPVKARKPGWTPPPGTTDCHMHIFGPAAKFAFAEPRDYSPTDCLMPLYKEMCATVGIERTVVVHPSVYGFDNSCSEQAVRDLGRSGRGVAVLPPDVAMSEVRRLHEIGFRGTRFNMVSAGGAPPAALEAMAAKIAEFGWHVQAFTTSAALAEMAPRYEKLPVQVVFDHIGGADPALGGIEQPGFQALLRLLDTGRAWVKVSGAYRVDQDGAPWLKAAPFAAKLIETAPDRVVWGTDWPHPHLKGRPMPNDGDLLDAIAAWTQDPIVRRKILVDNPARLYGFG